MLDDHRFGNSILGGFKRESVINYIDNLIKTHEEDLDKLKKEYKTKNDQLVLDLKKAKVLCETYKKRLDEAESFSSRSEDFDDVLREKEDLLRQKDQTIFEMKARLKGLEEELRGFKDVSDSVKKAESIAKDRINQIIGQGKAKILSEYKEQFDILKTTAMKEAAQIVDSAAAKCFELNGEVVEEFKKRFQEAKDKVSYFVESARHLAEKMLKDSAKVVLERNAPLDFEKFEIKEKVDVKRLNKRVNEEVSKAMEKLKSLDLFKEKVGLSQTLGQKKHKRVVLDVVRRRNKE